MYSAKVIADTRNNLNGTRLTTMEVCYPRIILPEMLTHREFSRNTASSRAVPVKKLLELTENNPFEPLTWGRNQPGMEAGEELDPEERAIAFVWWKYATEAALDAADALNRIGLHKEKVNRLIEPFSWTTQIISSTKWRNFFRQRVEGPKVQPEMRHIATMMKQAYDESTPLLSSEHLPYYTAGEAGLPDEQVFKICVARCARVSYLTHLGVRDAQKDIELHDMLVSEGHWSPLEHVAWPTTTVGKGGNFGPGWCQYRKLFDAEYEFE